MAGINWSNLFKPRRASRTNDDWLYKANPSGVKSPDLNTYANSYASTDGSKKVDGNAVVGQLGKLYQEYGPSLRYAQNNPGARGMVEAGLDYGMRQVPGVGQAYGAVQNFNRLTGGINAGKAFGIKQDPFKAIGNRIFGDPNRNQMTPAQMAILGRNATRSAAIENQANADIASARMERDRLGVQQRNVLDILNDLAANPQSSRDFASTVGAGAVPLQELASRRMADAKSSIARRGLSGGMATGLTEGTRMANDAGIAGLINQTTLAAMERRPQMVNALAGVIGNEQARMDARENAAMGTLGGLSQMDFQREMTQQQIDLDRQRLAAAERNATMQGLGGLVGLYGPDIAKEIQRIRTRGSNRVDELGNPLQVPSMVAKRPIQPMDEGNLEPLTNNVDFSQLPITQLGNADITRSPREIADASLIQNTQPVEDATDVLLQLRYQNELPGFVTPKPDKFGNYYVKTKYGFRKMTKSQYGAMGIANGAIKTFLYNPFSINPMLGGQ